MENYRVTASSLNVRSAPSTDAEIIGSLLKNETVESIEKSADGKWNKVKK